MRGDIEIEEGVDFKNQTEEVKGRILGYLSNKIIRVDLKFDYLERVTLRVANLGEYKVEQKINYQNSKDYAIKSTNFELIKIL